MTFNRILATFALVAVLTLGFWLVSEVHYDNCVNRDRTNCGHMPWQNGAETTSMFGQ